MQFLGGQGCGKGMGSAQAARRGFPPFSGSWYGKIAGSCEEGSSLAVCCCVGVGSRGRARCCQRARGAEGRRERRGRDPEERQRRSQTDFYPERWDPSSADVSASEGAHGTVLCTLVGCSSCRGTLILLV